MLPERATPVEDTAAVDHAVLWPLVCALPERQRAVVVLRYYEDLTEPETANLLGCTVGTVSVKAVMSRPAASNSIDQSGGGADSAENSTSGGFTRSHRRPPWRSRNPS